MIIATFRAKVRSDAILAPMFERHVCFDAAHVVAAARR